jgi:hypothetical protein
MFDISKNPSYICSALREKLLNIKKNPIGIQRKKAENIY